MTAKAAEDGAAMPKSAFSISPTTETDAITAHHTAPNPFATPWVSRNAGSSRCPRARALLRHAMEFEHADFHPFLWQAIFDVADGDQVAARDALAMLMKRLPDTTAYIAALASRPIFDFEPWKSHLEHLIALGLPRGPIADGAGMPWDEPG